MPKIKALIRIENEEGKEELEVNAILESQILKYKDNKAITKLNYKVPEIIRENEEYKIIYPFNKEKKTTGTILVKDINQLISVEITTKKLVINEHNVQIEYIVNNQKFIFEAEVIK